MNAVTLSLFAAALFIAAMPFMPLFKRILSRLSGRAAVLSNICCFAVVFFALTALVFSGNASAADAAETAEAASRGLADGLGYLGAALTTGMSTIGAGIAVGQGATAAIGATSEDPKMLSKGLIFVALGEGIVLYGLLMSFMILNRLS